MNTICQKCKSDNTAYTGRDFRGVAQYKCLSCGHSFEDEDDIERYENEEP